jgi:methyl-accepting chemotaxis protein
LSTKKLQFSFLVLNLGYAAILFTVIAVSLFAPLIHAIKSNDPASSEAYDAASNILYLHHKFWLPVFLTLIFLALHSLKTTHRIAGPLYRFRTMFKSIATGVIPKPLKLRKNDFLDTEQDAFNQMIESLRAQTGEVNRLAAKLHQLTEQYALVEDKSLADASTKELWNELSDTEAQLSRALGRTRVED